MYAPERKTEERYATVHNAQLGIGARRTVICQ